LVFLIILLILLAFIALILFFPVDLKLDLSIDGRVKSRVSIFYFFKIASWETGADSAKPKKKQNEKNEASDYSLPLRIFDILQIEGLWNRISLLFGSLQGNIHIRKIDSEIIVSLGEDYYTGMLAGLVLPLTLFLNTRVGNDIYIEPAFEEDLMLKGFVAAGMRFRPVNIIVPCLAFACSKPVRQARQLLVKRR
jgi:hypothetical protein